jgi:Interferon-induced 6-16 family
MSNPRRHQNQKGLVVRADALPFSLDTIWEQILIRIPLVVGAFTPTAMVAAIQGIGFTTSGITAGSFAATMMSFGGGATASGGLVATLQSIGAIGALSVSAASIVAICGSVTSGLVIYGLFKAIQHFKQKFDAHQKVKK